MWTLVVLLLLLAAYVGALDLSRPDIEGDRLRIDSFMRLVDEGRVRDARVLDEDAAIVGTYVREDGTEAAYHAAMVRGSQSIVTLRVLVPAGIPTTVDPQVPKRVAGLALFGLPALMLVVLFSYLVLSYRRGSGLFSVRSGARRIEASESGVRFPDVAGQDTAVAELRELKEFLADPGRFAALGATVPKGVLLYGPPGCGKTMLARALANEADASFFSISGSDFVEVYVGVGASRVRDLFKEARQNAPALIFIDELDAVGRARSTGDAPGAQNEQEQALNQILAEMDGFSTSEGVIVLGATNRPDVLDKALLRPGRFDRSIGLALPDEDARLAILSVHARTKALEAGVDLRAIAREAIGLSGADLASVMNQGALLAARAGTAAVAHAHLEQALKRILEDPERQRRLSSRTASIGRRYTERDRVTFADVGGQPAAVRDLEEVRDFLAHPERFAAMGAKVPRGVLLYGPPGCGKTLLARALAGEANAAFFSVTASEFVERFAGTGASRVRDLFAEARSMAPAIVFIDEIDGIGRARSGGGPAGGPSPGSEQEQALAQLLAEMDGMAAAEGLIVLGATNRPDTLDPALLRPGRFDRATGLALPDENGRLRVLQVHAEGKRLAPEVDLAEVARRAVGLSGADLANVLNEAAILAVREGGDLIGAAHVDDALDKVVRAPSDQRRLAMRGRSIGKRYAPSERVTFADVAGVDDAVAELREVREYLADAARFAKLGARVPRGILLSGPPGCGKTLLARAVAGEANAAFFSVAGSEFVEVFVGQGAARVRDLFGEAKSMAPAILFIDEIDAVGAQRSASMGGGQEREQTLNQILVEMDGFETSSGLIVMAATNRPDLLDSALVRPGRFDRHVALSLPDRAGRRGVLALHTRNKDLAADADLAKVAGLTQGFSGADLANVVNEAALLVARRGVERISMALLEEGVDRVRSGIASRGTVLTDEERLLVAYHESGHALVARSLPGGRVSHKLTVAARGTVLGRHTTVTAHDGVVHGRAALLGVMASSLGGAVAEELVYGETSTGAAHDLREASELARRMVREFGMSRKLGLLTYPDQPSSEEANRVIDAEVRALVDEAGALARSALSRPVLDLVARALFERETLTGAELDQLLADPPAASGTDGDRRTARSRASRAV